ncbi:hypothetical protein Misp01_46160 [Microtetraspora sp. NBRC 13810]|uniref:DUF4184 family protein n=1 Tax=Microtetraspora sp. NBRC 13810 TaxID=3030990 RepID=UPI0024A14C59|nr:DUF4184 family protein [Microtetraspora sp. NBRC 13810]GLW09487.1 hypothetical protein Misp01_46160 [Microtetraspora sp. NBRC 13810]
MPFTPSHIAAVLPLVSSARARRVLDPWALAIGSMAPDLPLFLPFLGDYHDWHSLPGLVLRDLPAALVLLALFHVLFRDPLVSLLPPGLAGRAADLPGSGLGRLPAIAAGAVTGAATHLLWDSFTHSWSAEFWGWPWLAAPVAGWVTVHRVLQYTSTVAGLAVLAWWCHRGLTRMEPRAVPGRLALAGAVRAGVLSAVVAAGCAAGLTWHHVDPPDPDLGWAAVVTKAGIGTAVGCFLALTVYAAVWHAARLARPRRNG